MLELARAVLVTVHAGAAAVWLGAMLYSLAVVQPRAARFFGRAERYEPFAVTLAAGARWKVLALCLVLALSGGGLVITEIAGRHDPSTPWLALVIAKGALLLLAVALFAHVSWRLWPARLFALPSELPAFQRRFRTVALGLTVVVASDFVLGAIADSLR